MLTLVALPIALNSLQARPAHKQAIATYFGPYLSTKLNACILCHLSNAPDEEDKPHNPFGARLKAVRKELEKTGRKTDIAARFEAIAEEDSDGDGVPNLLELITGHFPGDPKDTPTEAELVEGRKKLAAFLKTQGGYPWRPFEKVTRPPVPPVKDRAWGRNPIDAFIAAEHEARGLKPRPEACLLYTSPSPRDRQKSRMPSSA